LIAVSLSRVQRHLVLFAANAAALVAAAGLLPYATLWTRISVASAWLCMLLLCAALLIGPLRRAQGEPAPANIYLRRDLGIWAALQGFLHTYAGTAVSMNQLYMDAYLRIDTPPLSAALRDEIFLWSGIAAFIVSLLFLLLFLISSDRVLRWMRVERWKKVQRTAHLVLWLTVLHGLTFQLLEGRYLAFVLLAIITLVVFWLQYRGRRSASA
jgi:DMSO/TMAO reductase YedYZ heme-binding membrane subunit